jgi:hypothetical protein
MVAIKKTMFELVTINKTLPGDSPIIIENKKNFSLLKIKARICCLDSMHLRVFLVANHFQVEIKKNKVHQLHSWYPLVMEHTLKETPISHTWLLMS